MTMASNAKAIEDEKQPLVEAKQQETGKVKLYIYLSNGQRHRVSAKTHHRVDRVIGRLEKKAGIEIKTQTLIFEGNELRDRNRRLCDYGITEDEATLHLSGATKSFTNVAHSQPADMFDYNSEFIRVFKIIGWRGRPQRDEQDEANYTKLGLALLSREHSLALIEGREDFIKFLKGVPDENAGNFYEANAQWIARNFSEPDPVPGGDSCCSCLFCSIL